MKNRTGIIILAAGNSSRLGSPKQLLHYEGKGLLERMVDHASQDPDHSVLVVLGAFGKEMADQFPGNNVRTVNNTEWQQGMGGSIKIGMETLMKSCPDLEQCILAVCDQPYVTSQVFENLKSTAENTGKGIIATGYAETWGVPVLFNKTYFKTLLALNGQEGAKHIIRQHLRDMAVFPFEPARIDIDTREDYYNLEHKMVSVDEAKDIIDFFLPKPKVEHGVSLPEAWGHATATDIFATQAIPNFAQSSMDGYAIRYSDRDRELPVTDTIPAGTTTEKTISKGQAMRIFTGSPLPAGADTVVMQEKVFINKNGTIRIGDSALRLGDNVRPKGSEVNKGELAMRSGTYLSPAAIGYLAGIGIDRVDIFLAPRIAIVLTGNELKPLGGPLSYGEVYESNSYQLTSALRQLGIGEIDRLHARDDVGELKTAVARALQGSDILLLVGGVSVGDYDLVTRAATECGVDQRFHRIRQKPGKPLFFGTHGDKLVFGLPGNPSSALTCFYLYVAPAIEKIMNLPEKKRWIKAKVGSDYEKKTGLTHFLKAWYDGKTVTPLHAQESYRLQSYAQANCLLQLDETSFGCKAGDEVLIQLIV